MNRFFYFAFLAALAVYCLAAPAHAGAVDPDKLIQPGEMKPEGTWERVTVPDTLDLAERGRLAINYMTRNVVPDKGYSLYHIFYFDTDPPREDQLTWNLPPKSLRALPWMRTMCGSLDGLDVEAAIMRAYLAQIDKDGIVRYPYGGEGVPVGTSLTYTQGLVALAMRNWFTRDANPEWLKGIQEISRGLQKMAIRVQERAYYPPESGYKEGGEWFWTTRAGATPFMPYKPPEEPVAEQQGYEGCVKYDQTAALRALILSYQFNHDEKALDLANRVVRFMMKPGLWQDTTKDGYPGWEHGVWQGHFHGNVTALHGLFEYAMATKNEKLKQIVREGYDQAIRNSVIRMGWSPFWTPPGGFNRLLYVSGWCDTCNLHDTIVLAVKLTDAGMGDYWDDVESLARNQLAEHQFTDIKKMEAVSGAGDKNEAVFSKFVGGFGGAEPTVAKPLTYGCCSTNGPIGLYYAWHGITRFDEKGQVATVNMFLNRAAKWMDVDSWLPYEGKVVLTNKLAKTALVRIPGWVEKKSVKCFVNDAVAQPALSDNYLVFGGLQPGDRILLEFPVALTQSKYTMFGTQYTLTFRGNTMVDIGPRDVKSASQEAEKYKVMVPLYQREELKTAAQAPLREVKRFVADRILPLQ